MPSGCEKCPECGQDTLQRNYRGYNNGEAVCLQVITCGYYESAGGVPKAKCPPSPGPQDLSSGMESYPD